MILNHLFHMLIFQNDTSYSSIALLTTVNPKNLPDDSYNRVELTTKLDSAA